MLLLLALAAGGLAGSALFAARLLDTLSAPAAAPPARAVPTPSAGLRERCYHRLVARPSGVERCAVWGSADSGGYCNRRGPISSIGLA
jgi:hypothetical protein